MPLRIGWILKRINPKNLVISPVHGDLSNLPPVLAHANEVEMLLDDSRLSGQAADAEPRRSCVAHLQPRVA